MDDLPLVLSIVTLLSLGFALSVGLVIDSALAVGEVLIDGGARWDGTLHEGMGKDLLHRGTLVWVQGHHLLEEVLELVCVDVDTVLGLSVSLPENF